MLTHPPPFVRPLSQWHLGASGVGALATSELAVLYTCAMGCVKLLPLWSIGFAKVRAWPCRICPIGCVCYLT